LAIEKQAFEYAMVKACRLHTQVKEWTLRLEIR